MMYVFQRLNSMDQTQLVLHESLIRLAWVLSLDW